MKFSYGLPALGFPESEKVDFENQSVYTHRFSDHHICRKKKKDRTIKFYRFLQVGVQVSFLGFGENYKLEMGYREPEMELKLDVPQKWF